MVRAQNVLDTGAFFKRKGITKIFYLIAVCQCFGNRKLHGLIV